MKKQFILFALMAFALMAMAQSRNPYEAAANNEDEVVHLEQWQRHSAVPLQAIVKLQDYSQYTIVAPKGAKASKSSPSSTSNSTRTVCPAIQAVLDSFVVESVEQLCPTFVMPEEPSRSGSYGGGEVRDHDLSQLYLITLSASSPKHEYELIEALAALDEVEYAEPNYLVFALGEELGMRNYELGIADATAVANNSSLLIPNSSLKSGSATFNDPMYSLQWGIGACGIDSLLTAPKRDSAWRPVICILDTGVDIDHPDLAANIWTNEAEANGANNQDDDNNGFRDDVHGWDFVNQTAEMHDFNSHGTHCAGIAGAVTNNGIGIAGACPDALIMPVCVMQSDGTGDIATIIKGINYARQNGADVISMSFGSYAYSIAEEQALAVAYQTAVLVAAAGNDNLTINISPSFPGAFTFVFGVQATQQTLHPKCGYRACFSNYDPDPIYSSYGEEEMYNYELWAPGTNILSTVPNGGYRYYQGTSMACPLMAGGIASLLQRRDYATKELLFGDMINYSKKAFVTTPNTDFWNIYNGDSVAPAQLQFVSIEINDTLYGDGSMYADAGECVQLYPTIRTTWGPADSIEIWLGFDEFEDTTTIHILNNHILFGHPISSYSKAKSNNPIDILIDSNVVDGRHIKLIMYAQALHSEIIYGIHFKLHVTRGVKLHGMLTHNDTLWPNKQYIVTDNFGIVDGVELVIKPGTTLKFADGVSLSNAGKIYAVGTPDSMITFTKTDLGQGGGSLYLNKNDTIAYALIDYIKEIKCSTSPQKVFSNIEGAATAYWIYQAALLSNIIYSNSIRSSSYNFEGVDVINSCIYNNTDVLVMSRYLYNIFGTSNSSSGYVGYINISTGDTNRAIYGCNNNIINNMFNCYSTSIKEKGIRIDKQQQPALDKFPWNLNIFSNKQINAGNKSTPFSLYTNSGEVWSISPRGLYLGTGKQSNAKKQIFDFDYSGSGTFGHINLQYIAQKPSAEAHGLVWKVEVNGSDAQDEFDSISPLGVGTHEFKIYFNRAMDTSVTPFFAMGVRPPYTQTAISENASWNADSTIYTAYLTLTGRSAIDGMNRIYVNGAQDDEHFEIPFENQRFNVYVNSAGSMSIGFQAMSGIGKVDLEWNDQEVNYEDFLGFNIYRYQYVQKLTNRHYDNNLGQYVYDTLFVPGDTSRINQTLVQDTMYTDFDVVPGERYYYYYKILSTSLTENSPSKTVSCVPHSTIPGDANGSYNVDVADVIATINYVTGQNPQPFLFEAADVNGDGTINVLDIVGIINIILYPDGRPGTQAIMEPMTAIYTIENDTLYIETPVALAGLQFTISGCSRSDIEVLQALTPFECATVENGDELTMVFYSMSGATVPAGRTALLRIGAGELTGIALSDSRGQNVVALNGDAVGLTDLGTVQAQFATAYPNPFSDEVQLEMTVGNYSRVSVVFSDLMGRTVDSRTFETPIAGRYGLKWKAEGLSKGIYFATLYADGMKAQTIKLIVR